jgi:hypothetical protein
LDSLESWCSDDIEALLAVALAHHGARRDRRLIRPHGLPASDPPDRRRRRLPRGSYRAISRAISTVQGDPWRPNLYQRWRPSNGPRRLEHRSS